MMKQALVRRVAIGHTLLLCAGAGEAKDLVIHAGTLIDGVADTPRREVSILVRGANLIKLMPSGGIASTGDDPRRRRLGRTRLLRDGSDVRLDEGARYLPGTDLERV